MNLFKKTSVKVAENIKHIATNMNEILDADSLKILHACRSTCDHELSAAVEILECLGSKFGIFIVARAEDHHVGPFLKSGINTLLNGRRR